MEVPEPSHVGPFRYLGSIGEAGLLCPRPLLVHGWTDGNVIVAVARPGRLEEEGSWCVAARLVDDPGLIIEDLGEHPDERAAVGAAERWMRRGSGG